MQAYSSSASAAAVAAAARSDGRLACSPHRARGSSLCAAVISHLSCSNMAAARHVVSTVTRREQEEGPLPRERGELTSCCWQSANTPRGTSAPQRRDWRLVRCVKRKKRQTFSRCGRGREGQPITAQY